MSNHLQQIREHFEMAIKKAIEVQCSTLVRTEAVQVAAQAIPPSDCIGTIAMISPELVGSVSIGFPSATFLSLLSKMVGETVTELDIENSDACSELLNIIYGTARKPINEMGFEFALAIPATIIGKDMKVAHAQLSNQVILIKGETDVGGFWVSLSFKATSKKAA